MKTKTVAEIREIFLSFFESKGCFREKSSSLVPANDPTLLFTSAGMVQFKDVFTGNEKRAYTRATTAQKCLRAGGKHNDLENVGFTARHHTFFEMMGNFSFGDYFKKEAIAWAWELVTEKFEMPKERLHVTVFRDDDEAYDIWHKQIGIPKERIYRFDEKDNFWSAGDVGPCGPCTEIYFDRGEQYNTGDKELDRMGGDGGRYLEFYNLVFMQYNRDQSGKLSPLPKPSVDTGLGLERTASLLQNTPTNYDTDVFQEIIRGIEKLSGKKYSDGMSETSVAIRVIADHIRATSFLIADGVIPSNEGRGYVLRRILRRAVRYGKKLGFEKSFLEQLVPSLTLAMGKAYPELKNRESFIRETIKGEEEKFFSTLERGLQILEEELAKLKKGAKLPGSVAFLLYDSFGFPLDLTQVVCQERSVEVDVAGFDQAMEKQKTQSRGVEEDETTSANAAVYDTLKIPATVFTGYDGVEDSGKILALVAGGKELNSFTGTAKEKNVDVIFDRTPFYGESGGQAGDAGEILSDGLLAQVRDAKKISNFIVTKAEVTEGKTLSVGQSVKMRVNRNRRLKTMANHSATHLLHWALRKTLGTHVKQAGSLVNADLLRFDFTHMKALTAEEKKEIETSINEKVFLSEDLQTKLMAKDDAIAAGAMALFGEKYDEKVRVVSVGDGFSTELCGGTHVKNSAQIGSFVIASEAGVAAGVRRIVAYTGATALAFLKAKADALDQIRESLKAAGPEDTVEKVAKLQSAKSDLEKRIQASQAEGANALAAKLVAEAKKIKDFAVVSHSLEGGAEAVKTLGEKLKDRLPRGVIVLGASDKEQGKAMIQVIVTGDLSKTLQAGKLVQSAAPLIEGKGGGKPEQAQAGGTKVAGLQAAMDHVMGLLG